MGAAAAVGGSTAGLVLSSGGFRLLGLVAAAPCLLIFAKVAMVSNRHSAGIAGARQGGSP